MKTKKTIRINVIIETSKDTDYIVPIIKRGIYKMLDTAPYYIAAPNDVKHIDIQVKTFKNKTI